MVITQCWINAIPMYCCGGQGPGLVVVLPGSNGRRYLRTRHCPSDAYRLADDFKKINKFQTGQCYTQKILIPFNLIFKIKLI